MKNLLEMRLREQITTAIRQIEIAEAYAENHKVIDCLKDAKKTLNWVLE